jgi:hypothetical protein
LGGVVGETRVQEKGVRHVPQIWNGDPELQILHLLVIGFVLDFYASAITDKVEFLLIELFNLLERHKLVLFAEASEIQIELSYHDGLGHELNNWGFEGDFHFCYS